MISKIYSLIFIFLVIPLGLQAKKTYVPRYHSIIILTEGNDTLSVDGESISLSLSSPDNRFSLYVNHEDMTLEKIKSIKRVKAAAGWVAFSAALSGLSTGFSSNSNQFFVRLHNTIIAADLANMLQENAEASQKLAVEVGFENSSSEELMVADMDRGLVWYMKPKTALYLAVDNPSVLSLRISDLFHKHIQYATIAAGSLTKSAEVEWEDSEYWAFPLYERGESAMGTTYTEVNRYMVKHKYNGTSKEYSKKEFKEFKASRSKK